MNGGKEKQKNAFRLIVKAVVANTRSDATAINATSCVTPTVLDNIVSAANPQ